MNSPQIFSDFFTKAIEKPFPNLPLWSAQAAVFSYFGPKKISKDLDDWFSGDGKFTSRA